MTSRPSLAAGPMAAAPLTLTRRSFIHGLLVSTAGTALAATRTASAYQIGCYTRPWAEHEYRVALDGIAGAGFKFAGLMTAKGGVVLGPDTPPEKAAAMGAEAKSRGLTIASVYGGNFMTKKSVVDGVVALRKLVDNVAACGCPALLLGGTSRVEWVDDYYKIVAECCDYAASKRVGFSVKPHGGTNATGPQCRALLEKVGHRNFGLWYDPGNIFYYSDARLDPIDDAATVDALVVGMSVKDFRLPKEVNVTPGTGKVDFPKVFARLKRGGFTQGPLIIECLAPGDVAHVTAEAKKARLFVEQLVSGGS
jgi:sugar phosphate isomerase/epimerase